LISKPTSAKCDEVRLIFHSFKPLKDTEADAVKAVAATLKDYHVDFAFLHVAQEHDTVLFDSDNAGAKSYSAGVMKGEFAPTRGCTHRRGKLAARTAEWCGSSDWRRESKTPTRSRTDVAGCGTATPRMGYSGGNLRQRRAQIRTH
jgi:hypothetical protein